jgi:spermidine synthase
VLVGSRAPLRLDVDRIEGLMADSSARRDFRDHLDQKEALGILAHYMMSTDGVRAFASGALRNTDDHPRLEFSAPRNLFQDTWEMNVELLNEYKTAVLPEGLSREQRERSYGAVIEPLMDMGDAEFAAQALREYARMDRSSDQGLLIATSRLNILSGQLDQAEQSLLLAESVAAEPDDFAAQRHALWGRLYRERGEYARAIEHNLRAVVLDPSDSGYLNELAELHALDGQWAEAARWLERFMETEPYGLSLYWELMGEYLLEADMDLEAEAAFTTALELEPYSYVARARLAEILESRGESGAAIDLLRTLTVYAVDRDPDIYLRLANLYEGVGRLDEARRTMAQARRIFPTHTEIYKLDRELGAR